MAEYPQKTSLKVQMRGIHFGSQITHLEVSTKTNHLLNRTLVVKRLIFFLKVVVFVVFGLVFVS
jgi:hypothetical protein